MKRLLTRYQGGGKLARRRIKIVVNIRGTVISGIRGNLYIGFNAIGHVTRTLNIRPVITLGSGGGTSGGLVSCIVAIVIRFTHHRSLAVQRTDGCVEHFGNVSFLARFCSIRRALSFGSYISSLAVIYRGGKKALQ